MKIRGGEYSIRDHYPCKCTQKLTFNELGWKSTLIKHLTYTAAGLIFIKAGNVIGVHIKPHDLRRHAATYASRSGTPLEIVSKVLLRHSNLSTTQRYLGKISDVEAIRWIDNLHG